MDPVSITEEDEKYMKQCSNCGSWSPLASEVCTSCGGKEFREYKAPKEEKQRRQLGRTTASPVGTRKVCEICGTSNPEYVRNYCVRCGARL